MQPAFLRINSGNVRHSPHEGIICTNIRVPVTIIDKPKITHHGHNLVPIIDATGTEHWVDEFFLEVENSHNGNFFLNPVREEFQTPA